MNPTLALDMGGPLVLLFGTLMAAALGCGAGYVVGVSLGKTRPATPLPTTIRLSRDSLASACSNLEKASTKLNASRKTDLAGAALVLGRRVSDLSGRLGHVGRKAQHEEGSA